MSATVLITDYGFKNVDLERATIEGAGFLLKTAQCRTPEEVIEAAQDVDALIVQWAPLNARVIAALPKSVRVAVRYGIGVDNIDLPAAAAHGLPVCNVPDYCIDEVADHAMALALALARQLPQTHARTIAGEWKITPPAAMPAFRDMIFACAGFGRIARAVLARARAFGFRLAAYDPFVPNSEFTAIGVTQLSRDELFESANILSLHLPLNTETRHFIDATRLQSLRPATVLVNTSRGGLIDTVALAEALHTGRLGGAGLDVYETEPLSGDHPLLDAPNAILTSHTAWFSEASVPRLQRLAAEEAVRALRGESLKNQLNRAVRSIS
jgi:D-3-phosphoglycerate dehydrogenase